MEKFCNKIDFFLPQIFKLDSESDVNIQNIFEHISKCNNCFEKYLIYKKNTENNIRGISLFTNQTYEKELLPQIEKALEECTYACFNVAFIMRSGLSLLKKHIQKVINRNVKVDILTGTYMNATQPSALSELLIEFGDYINLRCYKNELGSFHPKTYFFKLNNGNSVAFIGSSNMTYTAMKTGVEWNCKVCAQENQSLFIELQNEFQKLLSDKCSEKVTPDFIRKYELSWRPNSIHDFERKNKRQKVRGPNPAQSLALLQLKDTRDEGYKKALVIAATGVGKTFLAAMDSQKFHKILFVAHVDEILDQAMKTFSEIHSGKSIGKFSGKEKVNDCDIIFATVQTLSKSEYLNEKYFAEDYFDYIIVDEFHHAAASSYIRILEYFKPSFLLGLTATPDRMDNRDIYSLCDQNVAYDVSLKKAVESQWLVPFHYYGIYDEIVDYDKVQFKNGKYNETELENIYVKTDFAVRRADLILQKYIEFRKSKETLTVGFCSSINHANFMANYFMENNIAAIPVHSQMADFFSSDTFNSKNCKKLTGADYFDRESAIKGFSEKNIKVLFVVDIFNEGIDIPQIEMELFIRPTESFTVFLQQLGRGLRLFEGKDCLTVLDFIGNYKNANFKPVFLTGEPRDENGELKSINYQNIQPWLPEGCIANFDFRLVNVFNELAKKKTPIEIEFENIYKEISMDHRPTMKEFFANSPFNHKLLTLKYKSWLDFLKVTNQANDDEIKIIDNPEFYKFFTIIEKTKMTKSYKIPVLYSFLNHTTIREFLPLNEIASYFKSFYKQNKYFLKDIYNDEKSISAIKDIENFNKIVNIVEKMPVNFLTNGKESEIFEYNKNEKIMSIKLKSLLNVGSTGVNLIKEILDFKIADYFRRKFS